MDTLSEKSPNQGESTPGHDKIDRELKELESHSINTVQHNLGSSPSLISENESNSKTQTHNSNLNLGNSERELVTNVQENISTTNVEDNSTIKAEPADENSQQLTNFSNLSTTIKLEEQSSAQTTDVTSSNNSTSSLFITPVEKGEKSEQIEPQTKIDSRDLTETGDGSSSKNDSLMSTDNNLVVFSSQIETNAPVLEASKAETIMTPVVSQSIVQPSTSGTTVHINGSLSPGSLQVFMLL